MRLKNGSKEPPALVSSANLGFACKNLGPEQTVYKPKILSASLARVNKAHFK
jgi:hypothetical protein